MVEPKYTVRHIPSIGKFGRGVQTNDRDPTLSYECSYVSKPLGRLPVDIAILIIEHDMDVMFRFGHEIVVLAQGRVLARGPPAAISADPRVRAVYLGKSAF